MMRPTLPEGWAWLGDSFRCIHVESGKQTGIAAPVIAMNTGRRSLQCEIDYQITKAMREINRDRIFEECGRDMARFRKRIAETGE